MENIFRANIIEDNKNMDKLTVLKRDKKSRIVNVVKNNKFISFVLFSFITFSMINFYLIYSFIKILESI